MLFVPASSTLCGSVITTSTSQRQINPTDSSRYDTSKSLWPSWQGDLYATTGTYRKKPVKYNVGKKQDSWYPRRPVNQFFHLTDISQSKLGAFTALLSKTVVIGHIYENPPLNIVDLHVLKYDSYSLNQRRTHYTYYSTYSREQLNMYVSRIPSFPYQ